MYYQIEPLFPGMTRIWDVARTAMYLIEGTVSAVLIDTGVGVGDLKEVINGLTDKPVTVLISHGHVDHALGAVGFSDVRISKADAGVYTEHSDFAVRKGYVMGSALQGGDPAVVSVMKDEDFMEPVGFEQFGDLNPGDKFELGGVSVEVLRGAGHTPGSVTMLIPEWRVLFLGDACNQFTFLFDHWAPSVAEYREMLLKLKTETDGRYDRVLVSHGLGEGCPDLIHNVIEVCDDVLAGRVDDMPFQSPFGKGLIAKAMDFSRFGRVDGIEGNIVYRPQ